jgi:primosomal protein N' (replication factor Y)
VLEVLDEVPLVTGPLLELAAWAAEYYMAPPGECYRLAFPPAGVRASRAYVRLCDGVAAEGDELLEALAKGPLPVKTLARRLGGDPSSRVLKLRERGLVQLEQEMRAPGFRFVQVVTLVDATAEGKGVAQAELLRRLRAAGGRAGLAELIRDRSSLRAAAARLAEQGILTLHDEKEMRGASFDAPESARSLALSEGQQDATETLLGDLRGERFQAALLHGVTASGKTEVYFRLIEETLARGKSALVLVPEIALTPMLVRAAAARFGATVSVLHSELSVGERHDQWWRIREGGSRLVIGARSAIWAPVVRLGLVVVDEEHEAAYKQEESPRYHARDVAVYRAKLEGALAVLGSATPSLESYTNGLAGKYRLLRLPERIGARALPEVEIVDRRQVLRQGGDPILTPPLLEALQQRLLRREQALLLLNRRGYATLLLCRECGSELLCRNCSVVLTVHQGGRNVECHYCGFRAPTPKRCTSCDGEYLRLTGYGTERVLEALRAALPSVRAERFDRDLARKKGAVLRTLQAFESGALDVLVGTQMIAKGHDFPRVTLVGVIDADVGLGLPDFRSAERTFQLLTQVAGRAGRGEVAGQVILQSHQPNHYALQLACAQDYAAFYEREMEFRRTMGYPPAGALIDVIFRARGLEEGLDRARRLATRLRASAERRFRVLGPALAPLARIKQEHRCQVVLKGKRAPMRAALREALAESDGARPVARRRGGRRPGQSDVKSESTTSRKSAQLTRIGLGVKDSTKTSSPITPHEHARASDRRVVIERARMPTAEERQQDAPEQPRRPKVEQAEAAEQPDARNPDRALAEQRVDDVAAVELAHRHQVEGGDEEAEPAGGGERPHQECLALRRRSAQPLVAPLQQERLSERNEVGRARRRRRYHAGIERAEDQHRDAHHEPCERSRDADVEERLPVGDRPADADEGAERADEAQDGHRDEVGQRRVDAVAEAGDVVAHLVRDQDRHQPEHEHRPAHQVDREHGQHEEHEVETVLAPCAARARVQRLPGVGVVGLRLQRAQPFLARVGPAVESRGAVGHLGKRPGRKDGYCARFCRSLPGLKRIVRPGGILTSLPVRGLRPMPRFRGFTWKTPKPRSSIRSPFIIECFIASSTASTAISARTFVMSAARETSLMMSTLIMDGSPCKSYVS